MCGLKCETKVAHKRKIVLLPSRCVRSADRHSGIVTLGLGEEQSLFCAREAGDAEALPYEHGFLTTHVIIQRRE